MSVSRTHTSYAMSAKASVDSILPPSYTVLPPSFAWRRAVDRYAQDNSLTAVEQNVLRLSSPTSVVTDLQVVDLTQLQRSRIRKGLEKLQPLFECLGRFERAIDVFTNADSFGVLALVWGSMRMCLVVLKDFVELYEIVISFLLSMEDDISRLTAYEALFREHKRFNLALCSVFESLLEFCAWLRMKTKSKTKFVAKMVFVGSMKKEAALRSARFRALCIKTESEAQLAGAESVATFQDKATKLLTDVKAAQQAHTAGQQNELLRSLHEKLLPIPVAEYLDTLQRMRSQGTCSWIMNSEHLRHLLEPGGQGAGPRLTWVTGIPGCGKTYLSAFLIGKLQATHPVGYFFCDVKDIAKRSSSNILRTWAWQLCQSATGIAGEVLRLIDPMVEITTKLLSQLFRIVLKQRRAFLVLDGLDECEAKDRSEILDVIGRLATLAHVIVVSRKERDIELKLRDLEEDHQIPVARVQISSDDTMEDIKRYLVKEVLKCDIKDPILVTKVIQDVSARAKGMFLYARLVLNELNQSDTDEERLEVLDHLPTGIDEVYGRSMNKIKALSAARKARVIRLLQCVMYAARPLTLSELGVALAVVPGEKTFRHGNIPNVSKLFLEFCTSLLELDEENDALACIHATAKEYLMFHSDEPQLTSPTMAHANMVSVCVTYLTQEDRTFVDRSDIDVQAIPFSEPWPWFDYLHSPFFIHLEEHKLIQYSAANWMLHLSYLANVTEITESVKQCLSAVSDLLSSEEKILQWLETFHFLAAERLDQAQRAADLIDAWILQYEDAKLGPGFTAHFAEAHAYAKFAFSFNGFPQVDTTESDALRQASTIYPSPEIMAHLEPAWSFALDHLGFSSEKGIYRWRRFIKTEPITRKPVHMAAFFDFTDFVEKQLASGVDVNDRCVTDRSIINKAAFGEATRTCKLLLDHDADIDQTPMWTFFDGTRPLGHAMYDDQFIPLRPRDYGTARFLLRAGAKVQVDANPLHPLHTIFDFWSETDAQLETLKELMDNATDIVSLLETHSPYSGMSPLHIVARNNLSVTVRKILERHPDRKSYASRTWGADAKTALHEACFASNSRAGPILLEIGLDINVACVISKSTPLHISATARSDMLPRLLALNADANLPDAAGRLPLHLAAIQGWDEATTLLLPHTADINTLDSQGYSALSLASLHSCRSTVQTLLRAGASSSSSSNSTTSSTSSHHPTTSSAIFHAAFLLSVAFGFRASPVLLRTILNKAEYWLVSTNRVVMPFAIEQADAGRAYLISKPLSVSGSRIQKIRVQIHCEAREGEYTALFPERRSWTWFRLARQDVGDKGQLVPGPDLVRNNIDVEGRQSHDCVVHVTDQANDDVAGWVRKLMKGERVAVVPMARWPGRVNTVYEATLDISTTVLKGEEEMAVVDSGERERRGVSQGWLMD